MIQTWPGLLALLKETGELLRGASIAADTPQNKDGLAILRVSHRPYLRGGVELCRVVELTPSATVAVEEKTTGR